jgi:SAM-dependent methyltransferase
MKMILNKKKLNLGCGKNILSGYVNIDIKNIKGVDLICDLEELFYPFRDSIFHEIYCNNILEHLNNLVNVMKELHRIAKSRARIIIKVPHFTCQYAFADPTHKHYFTYESFDYFLSNYRTESNRPDWYTQAKFSLLSKKIIFSKGVLIPWNYFLEFLFNKIPKYYEGTFLRVFPAEQIHIELEVLK